MDNSRPIRRGAARALVGLSLLIPLLALPAVPANAAFAVPSLVRTIAGTGRAALFPWGMAYSGFSHEFIVSDYLNYQLRRYADDGTYVADLPQPTGADGDPESVLAAVAVDPTNGDIYVAKPKPDTIAHYDPLGNRLPDIAVDPSGVPAQTYTAWLTVGDDGSIYVLDSSLASSTTHPARLIKLAPGGASQLWSLPLLFPQQLPTQAYGIDVASTGRIFISDSINRRVQMVAPDGSYWGSFGFAGDASTIGALSGDLRGVLVDDLIGRVYVVDAIQSQIEVYSTDGTPLFHFGGQGVDPGQLRGPRQLALDADGNVCVTEYGGYRIQCFDVDGNTLRTFPSPSPAPPVGQLGQPRDVAVDTTTGNVWVADSWNERFQKFAPDGTLLGSWGFRGSTAPYGLKYPRGIGFDPVNHRVWVTIFAAGTIYVYDDQANFLFQIGDESIRRSAQAGYFEKPQAVAFGNGFAYVSDVGSQYPGDSPVVKILDASTGAQVGTIPGNSRGVVVDQATGNVFVALFSNKISVYPPMGGTAIVSFGSKGNGNGQFQSLWDVAVIGSTLYASDDALSRIQAFTLPPTISKTTPPTFAGKWGGYGTNAYLFRNPSGLSVDAAGMLYVADATNDRIEVFNPAVPKPAYEFSRPSLSMTAPANGAFIDAPVTFAGTASDNALVASVELAIQDQATGRWWEPTTGTWQTGQSWCTVPYAGGSPTSVTWSWVFPGAQYGGDYHVEVRARDGNNTLTAANVTRDIHVRKLTSDAAPPTATLDDPVDGSVLPLAPLVVVGTASDDTGVASIETSVQHTSSGLWWTGSVWSATQTWFVVVPGSPGAALTSWSWSWTPPAAAAYTLVARSVDLAGNRSGEVQAGVTVDLGGPDTVAPDGTVASVKNNQTLPLGPVVFAGAATDNAGVADVQVGIKNRDTGLWWKASTGTWVTAFTWNPGSVLSLPAGSPTSWSYGWTPAVAGNYTVTVRALDAAGNADATRPWINFIVS
jgi:sugar lactone lactonase YvrE